MTSNICDISKHSISANDLLLFDANIWIYLWSPPHSPNAALSNAIGEYSRIYTEMVNQGVKILTSWLVLSEFVNALARKSFQKHLELHPSSYRSSEYKRYRNSNDFTTERQAISGYIKKILKKSRVIPHSSNNLSHDNILDWYENNADFNDAVYVEDSIVTCYKIVTHDMDFKRAWGTAKPTILTANQRILKN